ncbi:MAG TPA: molybdopterin cofactor-binding domain-containing protein [Puia sp.]|nr:molybdopterin cofactor-binding domain-containing protein [Puia sp.]
MIRSSRRDFIKTTGSLTIGFCLTGFASAKMRALATASPDLPGDLAADPHINAWLQVLEDNRIRVLTGKLELGQGIRTAVAQVAAEELNMDMNQVEVLVAETGQTPDEGYTAGSNSIEMSAIAIRYAAAAAHKILLDEAAKKLDIPATRLTLEKGIITGPQKQTITITALLAGRQLTDEVRLPTQLKPAGQHRLIGKPIPRPDNELICHGHPYHLQDLQFPGMAYGAVIRPPSYGAKLKDVDENAIKAANKDIQTIIRNGSFLAVITTNQHQAFKAQKLVHDHAQWEDVPPLPNIQPNELPAYLRTLPVRTENVAQKGSIAPPQAAESGKTIKASYSKPYIMHGAIGPSCAIAKYEKDKLDVWSHSQGVYPLRESLAAMLGIPAAGIHVKGVAGSGCYGHNGADDVAADAALMAVAFPGKHIYVQWSRDDEHAWEPYGSAMLMDLEATLDAEGKINYWNYALYSDTHGARPSGHAENLLPARYLEKPFTAKPSGFSGGAYRNAEPYYNIPNQNIRANFFDGPLRASSLRSLGAFANIFAIESFMEELATAAGKDPFEFRLQHLQDDRARAVLDKLKEAVKNEKVGIAFSRYKNGGTYCAVAAKVKVTSPAQNTSAANVKVTHLWAVVDAGEVINLDGIKNQIEGGMVQATSWTLLEQVRFDEHHVTSRDWATYPILHMNQAPRVEVLIIDRPDQPSLGAGEAAQGPTAAAITNAIYHATGKRIRNLPVM